MTSNNTAILVVDDDAIDLRLEMEALETLGVELLSASTAEEALAIAERDPAAIGCVVLDYVLPGLRGTDMLEMLRRIGVDCPAVFVTGNGSEEDAVAVMKAGAFDYLTKASLIREPHRLRDAVRDANDFGSARDACEVNTRRMLDTMAFTRHKVEMALVGYQRG